MSNAFEEDRGAAERAVLYGRTKAANNPGQGFQQSQIIKLLEQVRNRLTDIDKERSEIWDAIGEQTKTITEMEDRSTSTEKTYLSLENRLSRSELNEAPLVERLDEIERNFKDNKGDVGEDLKREILDRIEESDLQTARLIERIDEAMAMQTRMTRRIDKVVQDKQRLNRKISLLEESMDATRQALSAKALVLLSDKSVAAASAAPSIPLFRDTKDDNDIFADDMDMIAAQNAAHKEQASAQKSSNTFAKQAVFAGLFVVVAGAAGWMISQNVNPQMREDVPVLAEHKGEDASIAEQNIAQYTPRESNYTPYVPTIDRTQSETANSPQLSTYNNLDNDGETNTYPDYTSYNNEAELAEALNDIEPSAPVTAEPVKAAPQIEESIQAEPAKPQAIAEAPVSATKGDQNLPDSFKNLETQAISGNAEAQHDLAVVYTAGRPDVPQNFERAAYWFTKASNQGIANARYNLGVLYHQGLGVEQNLGKAIDWYKQAAQLGHSEAQYNLGIAYIEGIGVNYDPKRAAEYFESAAAGGVPEAAFNLGLIFENGLTGEAQPNEAILWYKTASDLGNADAKNAIEQLAKAMNINMNDVDAIIERMQTPQSDKRSQLSQTQQKTNEVARQGLITDIQKQLVSLGLYPGPADGNPGPLTSDAIRLYQARHEMAVNGQASEDLLVHMMTKNLRNSSFIELGSRQ